MNKKEKEQISNAIEDHKSASEAIIETTKRSVNPADFSTQDLPRIENDEEKELRIEIPKCLSRPVNGRIFVISIANQPQKSLSGLWIPRLYAEKKDQSMKSIDRFFIVAWASDIPPEIKDHLKVGIEVGVFIPQEAEGWSLPKYIDWQTGNEFPVVHFTELAGISKVQPEEC